MSTSAGWFQLCYALWLGSRICDSTDLARVDFTPATRREVRVVALKTEVGTFRSKAFVLKSQVFALIMGDTDDLISRVSVRS